MSLLHQCPGRDELRDPAADLTAAVLGEEAERGQGVVLPLPDT
jgi:hypothetical protein